MSIKSDKRRKPRRVFLPTATDIRQACALIREGWSAGDYRRRSGGLDAKDGHFLHWLPPLGMPASLAQQESDVEDD